jgi:hypothetical protein
MTALAPSYGGLFSAAVERAKKAYEVADRAYEVADQVRTRLGDKLGKAHLKDFEFGENVRLLKAGLSEGGKTLVAQVYDSHDEYLGEAAGIESDGFGVVKVYHISEEATPHLRASYSGLHERNKYGPLGVYTFPNQAQIVGDWVVGSPSFGYREFFGHNSNRPYDFYLGNMCGVKDRGVLKWFPHGEGISVDAGNRRVCCGEFFEGVVSRVRAEFSF